MSLDQERERRRQLMAQQAESRHTAQMTRGIGNPAKVLGKTSAPNNMPVPKTIRVGTETGQLPLEDRRIDPDDGLAYTLAEFTVKYQGVYSKAEAQSHFMNHCVPAAPAADARSPCGHQEASPGSWDSTDSTASDIPEEAWDMQAPDVREMGAVAMALENSLQGVTFSVRFFRPDDAGGAAAGRAITLGLDALALLDDVQAVVEVEMFGAAGREPAYLTFNGQYVPGDVPIYHLGIGDGDTVMVDAVGPFGHDDDDFEDDPILRWAASG